MSAEKKSLPLEFDETLEVSVLSTQELLWSGLAKSVSSKNSKGPFDVLPRHRNFVTLIQKEPIIIRTMNGEERFVFDRTIIHVKENIVRVYVDF